jgi:hypothetical protein
MHGEFTKTSIFGFLSKHHSRISNLEGEGIFFMRKMEKKLLYEIVPVIKDTERKSKITFI